MTNEELEAIKRRAEAATPGPWWAMWVSKKIPFSGGPPIAVATTARNQSAVSEKSHIVHMVAQGDGHYDPAETTANAEFIAAARSDVPALVAEVEKLRGLLEEALPQLDHYSDGLSYFPQRSEMVKLLASKIREALGEK